MARRADLAFVGATFGDLLRRDDVPVSFDQVARFIRAIELGSPATLDELYWTGRVTLLTDRAHIDTYDRVFNQVFGGIEDWADTRGDPNAPPPARRRQDRTSPTRLSDASAEGGSATADRPGDGEGTEREVDVAVASGEERLATTDFAELDDDERRQLRELMRQIRISAPVRAARRRRRHRRGDHLDLRATLRRSRRTGGDPIHYVAKRPRQRPRRIVVLCDISGSMAPYARACIQLLHAAAGGSRAEVFAFATRLTRLTRPLSLADPDAALAMAAAAAPDWKGGTRIGPALKEFIDGYGRRGVARGAVVVIVSDGWDRGDPAVVAEQMQRLRRLAYRIVWINPRQSAPGFAPLAGGMAAALPHCDAFVGGSTLVALQHAVGAMGESTIRRSPMPDRSRERASGPPDT